MIKAELSDILPFIRFPIMSLNYLHLSVGNILKQSRYPQKSKNNDKQKTLILVPKAQLFSSFEELGKILCDATEFASKGSAAPRTSQYSNKSRECKEYCSESFLIRDKTFFSGHRIHFVDAQNKRAHAFLSDKIIAHFLHYVKHAVKGYNYSSGGDNVCHFNVQMPKLSLNSQIIPGPDPQLYVVQLSSKTIVIKALPSDTSMSPTVESAAVPWGMLPLVPPPRKPWKLQKQSLTKPMLADGDVIIAKLILDDHDFSINQGCVLHVIDPKNVNAMTSHQFSNQNNSLHLLSTETMFMRLKNNS